MLSKFFLKRPVFAWVIAIVLMVAGGLAIYNLPISQYPPIAPPSIAIEAFYPGASAETVENSVTQLIEQKMANMSTREWYQQKGRHTIYARPDKDVPLPADGGQPVTLRIRKEDGTFENVDTREIQTTTESTPDNGNGNGHKSGNGNGKDTKEFVPINVAGAAMPTRESLDSSVEVNSGGSCCH